MERDTEKVIERRTSQGLKYIPSFNEFAGDVDLGPETDQQGTNDATKAVMPKTLDPAPVDPWRGVFDPASNPKTNTLGSNYFDTVKDPKQEPSTWDFIIRSERLSKSSFYEIDQNKDGMIDKAELAAKLGKRYDADALMKQADVDKDGKISPDEFSRVLDATSA